MIVIRNMLLKFLGVIGDGSKKLKVKTSLSTSNMKALQVCNYSNQKSVKELELHCQSINKAIEDAIQYFNTNNKY